MPLTRLNEGYRPELEGVEFGMTDEEGTTVRCLVTDEALTDAIGGIPEQAEKIDWFVTNRSDIESVASELFDQGVPSVPQLRIGTRNLNPQLFEGI